MSKIVVKGKDVLAYKSRFTDMDGTVLEKGDLILETLPGGWAIYRVKSLKHGTAVVMYGSFLQKDSEISIGLDEFIQKITEEEATAYVLAHKEELNSK